MTSTYAGECIIEGFRKTSILQTYDGSVTEVNVRKQIDIKHCVLVTRQIGSAKACNWLRLYVLFTRQK